ALRGLRPAEARGVDREPEPAVRAAALQLQDEARLVEGAVEDGALDRLHAQAEGGRDRRPHVAAPDRAERDVATDARAGGQEEGRVVGVERALAVGAEVLRRAVLVVAARG